MYRKKYLGDNHDKDLLVDSNEIQRLIENKEYFDDVDKWNKYKGIINKIKLEFNV